jgi:hypothetical protein
MFEKWKITRTGEEAELKEGEVEKRGCKSFFLCPVSYKMKAKPSYIPFLFTFK